MLNELYQLYQALNKANIPLYNRHPQFKELPNASEKKPCFKVVLGVDGTVRDIQSITPDLVKQLRKWEPSLGDSFPGLNIQPVYRVTDEDEKKLIKKWREGKAATDLVQLKTWCTEASRNWDQKAADKMQRCLQKIPQKLMKILGDVSGDYQAIQQVIDRAGKLDLPTALEAYVWAKLESGSDFATLLPILLHEGSDTQNVADDRGSLSVFLDVQDWSAYPVAHERTMQFLNERLLLQRSSKSVAVGGTDAYGLQSDENDKEEKLPEVKLPALGGVKLRAMNKESSCQYRYGTIDAASFPIGQESRKRAQGALEWLADSKREGQTWGRADSREILFAYPANMPAIPPKLAVCLGTRKESDKSARFAAYAKDVIGQLKGINTDLKHVELHVFSLRKMDKARTKVVFHRNYSAERLAVAAEDWQKGCDNIPAIRIPAWGDEKGESATATPEAPFPLQVAGCLNRVWKMDGSTKCEVDINAPTMGVELLLDAKDSRYVSRLLSIAIQNGKGLFFSLGNAIHRGERVSLKGYDKQIQWMPALLGLLLHKSGIGKDRYMITAPYLIGNMLKIADDLHALYCKEVRTKKDAKKVNLPPQLLGNALMATALESPVQVLSQLARRLLPYMAWARTNSTDAAGLSRYFMKCFGEIEAKLRGQTLPARLNDAERAQLLLGYIASSEKTGSNNANGKGE